MKVKKLHPCVLKAIETDYTYHQETGILCRKGKDIRLVVRTQYGAVRDISVIVHDPNYATMWCQVAPHRMAWYLHYHEWPEKEIDHIDGDPANNKINNLRLATREENCQNRRKKSGKFTSTYKGVCYDKDTKKWLARITKSGKSITLGYFTDQVEAAQTYDKAALELHGSFAATNFRYDKPIGERPISAPSVELEDTPAGNSV